MYIWSRFRVRLWLEEYSTARLCRFFGAPHEPWTCREVPPFLAFLMVCDYLARQRVTLHLFILSVLLYVGRCIIGWCTFPSWPQVEWNAILPMYNIYYRLFLSAWTLFLSLCAPLPCVYTIFPRMYNSLSSCMSLSRHISPFDVHERFYSAFRARKKT